MNKKLLTMVTTGAIAISNMNFAFADIPECGIPKGEKPIFEKIPNAHIPEIEMLMEEFDDEAVEPGDDIMDDVISGEEYEEEEIEDVTDEDEPIDEEIIDEAEMERLEREEHEKELAEKEQAEEDDEIMDEIEKDAEKYYKENEEDVIGGIDDDYYDVGEEEEVKDEDPAENTPDEEEEVEKSNNKEATHNATVKDTNVSNDTTRAIDKSMPSQQSIKGNSGNPKTGDIGIIGSIAGMIVGLGGLILRKKF